MSGALLERARLLLAAGRVDHALSLLREAERAAPANAGIPHDIGYLALSQGRHAEAASAFSRALAADPTFALAALRLGVARQALGEVEPAIAAYRVAAGLAPARADARFRLGALLEALGRWPEAEDAYREAAATRPETPLSRLADARLLLARDRLDEAETALRALLANDPGHLEAVDTLGSVLADTGRLDEAAGCYETVTGTSLQYAGSFYDLVRCRRVGPGDGALVAAMEAAASAPALHAEARAKVHLALGKAADDLGDPGRAMRHFGAADAVRRGGRADEASGIERRVARLVERFDAHRVGRAAAAAAAPDRTPILVTGLPRSGTTLVEQILSSHPDVHGAGELPFWASRGAAWESGDTGPDALARMAGDYLAMLRDRAPGPARVTDKAPLNLYWAGLIRAALPGATIVVCRRRPIDTALSIHRTWFNPLVDFPTGGGALVSAVRALERLADHWRAVFPPGSLHEVCYEALVADPETATRALVAACGLSWNDACLAPERNRRPVRTPSRWQVRSPITAPAPDAWRRYERWLGPLAALL